MIPKLPEIAKKCRAAIEKADRAGVMIDDGNVVDLCADKLPRVPLDTIRDALVVAGLAARFPKATRDHHGADPAPWERQNLFGVRQIITAPVRRGPQQDCDRLRREFDEQHDRYKAARAALPKRGRSSDAVVVINGIRHRLKAVRSVAKRGGCNWPRLVKLPPALAMPGESAQQSLFGQREATPAQQAARDAFKACSLKIGKGVEAKKRRMLMSICLRKKGN